MQVTCSRLAKTITVAFVAMALAACGRSNSDSGGVTIPGMTTASVSGALSGGTMVAVDAATNTEVGRIASSGNGDGSKSFSLPLGTGRSYKFYLVLNEGTADQRVYPLYQGDANRFNVASTTSIELGFISTTTGIARTANDITRIKGVAGAGEDKTFPASLAASAFTSQDLQGDWQVLQMVSGSSSRWIRSSLAMDAAGASAAASYQSSLDSGTTAAASYAITPGGVVTVAGGLSNIFSGVMARDKSIIIGTSSPDAGNHALVIMLKSGTGFSAADLAGDWKFHQLAAGVNAAWARGDASVDADGVVSIFNAASSAGAGGKAPETLSGTLTTDATGIVTSSTFPAFYGVMSASKDLLFAVNTDTDGAPSLTVFSRVSREAFSMADLGNSWRANWLSATGSKSGTPYWGHALFDIDVWHSYLRSIVQSYGTSPDATVTIAMMTNGVVGFDNTNFSGMISPAKNVMVGVMTEGAGNFSLYTFIK